MKTILSNDITISYIDFEASETIKEISELIISGKYFEVILKDFKNHEKFFKKINDLSICSIQHNYTQYIDYDNEIRFAFSRNRIEILRTDYHNNNDITIKIETDSEDISKFKKLINDIKLYIDDKDLYLKRHVNEIIIK